MLGSRSFSAMPTPAMRSPRADRADEAVHVPLEVVENLRAGRFVMSAAIGDVVELVRPDRAVRLGLRQRVCETAGIADVVVRIGVGNGGHLDQLGPGHPQHVLLFLGLGVRDDDDRAIAQSARHHRDADARIACRALDD